MTTLVEYHENREAVLEARLARVRADMDDLADAVLRGPIGELLPRLVSDA